LKNRWNFQVDLVTRSTDNMTKSPKYDILLRTSHSAKHVHRSCTLVVVDYCCADGVWHTRPTKALRNEYPDNNGAGTDRVLKIPFITRGARPVVVYHSGRPRPFRTTMRARRRPARRACSRTERSDLTARGGRDDRPPGPEFCWVPGN
jgi:hypothetical protein